MKKFSRILALFLTAALMTLTFAACASGGFAKEAADSYYPEATYMATTAAAMPGLSAYEDSYAYAADMEAGGGEALTVSADLYTPQDNRKLIRQANLAIETENYDESVQAIQNQIAAVGAYIESSQISGYTEYHSRSMHCTVRIPADRFDEFMAAKDTFGVVMNSNVWQEDVTFNYFDMEARLQSLNTKKDRLMALLEEATKMSDIIELENALSDTIAEIESYTSSLSRLDNQIAYCTVTINLDEVYHAAPIAMPPKTLSERISQRFSETMDGLGEFGEDFLVFIVGASPVLLILAVIIFLIVFISVKASRKRRRKMEAAKAKRRELEAQAKIAEASDENKE